MHLRTMPADLSALHVSDRLELFPSAPSRSTFTAAARRLDLWLVNRMARCSIPSLRISLGVIFLWFGALKFFPGLSPAQELATRTMELLTFGLIRPNAAIVVLATWECAIGLGLIFGYAMRVTLVLLFLQMLGTLTPIVLFPQRLFSHLYIVPTLEGQYIIKNIVLISGGLIMGGTLRGGFIVADPSRQVARERTPRLRVLVDQMNRELKERARP
jgi:uncharacterized membrane protein YphA (DoxX/SURF4 family)